MNLIIRVTIFLFICLAVENKIYLYNTQDGRSIEYYDCVVVESLLYCRRPREAIELNRDDDTISCMENSGQLHWFSDLRSNNTNVSTILHHWRSGIERVEQYSLFLNDGREKDGFLCQCLHPASFGKNCEYQLPAGETLEETLDWQVDMRKENPQDVQVYGDVICYQMLGCDSGVLCLDWREICDGIQNCLEGNDEENCDLLEMNRCEENEYRCVNGMCIPDSFFLDGELDCLDWSDEMSFKKSEDCFGESVSAECDDHLCPLGHWSCGDGQCIPNRLAFQRSLTDPTCRSGRDQYFICETHPVTRQWTMPNGRCYPDGKYQELLAVNPSVEQECEHLLKCVLSMGGAMDCRCYEGSNCTEAFSEVCPVEQILYPRQAVIAPYIFFLYNRTRDWQNKRPDLILINGTVRCRNASITVTKTIPFDLNLCPRQMIEEHFCRPARSEIRQECHHRNESTDVCNEWNPCLSITRIRDGTKNCLNSKDEEEQREMSIEQSCAQVRRHRLRCSSDQSTCLNVMLIGNGNLDCRNGFDESWLGTGRKLRSLYCDDQREDECSFLRQYIDQSWTVLNASETGATLQLPFRSYCDTFENLATREDESLSECRQWWICRDDQRRCGTGQCVEHSWFDDGDWDCPDASDEYQWMKYRVNETLRRASRHNFTNRSYLIPSSCNQSHPFLCLSSRATQQGFSCLNFSQIGDGQIDCAGAIDERNTLRSCSDSSILGNRFFCLSTNSCIPFLGHCLDDQRCPNQSDDEHWCSRQTARSSSCDSKDFVCFDGRCFPGGRCNRGAECLFVEDEYMCDYLSSFSGTFIPFREEKRIFPEIEAKSLRLSFYPSDAKIEQNLTQWLQPFSRSIRVESNISELPYWCNRGLGVLLANGSSVCFCPPQYFGEKCEYHQDRLSVLFFLNVSQSIYSLERTHPSILFKLLVLLVVDDRVFLSDQLQLFASFEIDQTPTEQQDNLIIHFVYPRWLSFRDRPFSIRFQLYRTPGRDEQPLLLGTWQYPVHFGRLPVFRLAKVLYLRDSNPCLSDPCPPNARCHRLLNNNSAFLCLCKSNFSGKNCSEEDSRCRQGYCSKGSLCEANSFPDPLCVCPSDRFGVRCSLEHDVCHSNPCQNGGRCFPDFRPDRVICLCTREYFGFYCQGKRVFIELSLSTDLSHRGGTIQFFEIDHFSLNLIPLNQKGFRTVPQQIEYLHYNTLFMSGIVLAKLSSSEKDLSTPADLHLLSVFVNVLSVRGRTTISSENRCSHLRSFSSVDSSPIRYHQICIDDATRLCFRDDVYLCICAENHTRVECFLYDDQLDQCSHCLSGGRCLQGDRGRSDDFLCLCPSCHSGRQCQFSSESFTITLDQLFFTDLLSERKFLTATLLILFPLLGFVFSLPSNLFSFSTLRRRNCLRTGCGLYLLCLSVINQLSLALLAARLIHLTFSLVLFPSHPIIDDLLCRLLNYSLTCFTRLVYWLIAFVSLERAYTSLFLNKQWLKQPHIARRLMVCTFVAICLSAVDELLFLKSFSGLEAGSGSMCIIEYPPENRSMWIHIHQIVSVVNFLVPLLINICCTSTIIGIVIQIKMNVRRGNEGRLNGNEMRRGRNLFRGVLNENREIITRPVITVVPSMFSLFSLPFLIVGFSLGCQISENSSIRYLLIAFYFLTFVPQMATFLLYIYPSSFYRREWQATSLSKRITALRRHPSLKNSTTFSTAHEHKNEHR